MSDKKKHLKDKDELKELIETVEESFNITIDPDTFKECLKTEVDKIARQQRKFKQEKRELEDELSESIDRIKEERTSLDARRQRGESDLRDARKSIAAVKKELYELDGAGEMLEQIRQEWERKNKELVEARVRMDEEKERISLKGMKEELKQLDIKEDGLKSELASLEEHQAVLQKVDYLESDISSKTEKRGRIMKKRNSTFLEMFPAVPEPRRLKGEFRLEQERLEKLVKENEVERTKIENEITAKKNEKSQMKKNKAKRTIKEREHGSRVGDVLIGKADLEKETQAAQENLEALEKELRLREAGKYTYSEMLNKMGQMDDPACPTCNRGFNHKSEAQELKAELNEMIDAIPRKLKGTT